MDDGAKPLTSEWPKHFPATCPPADADAVTGPVFRLVKSDPPSTDDMKSYLELGRAGPGRECQRAGLSCATNQQHLEELTKLPRFRGQKVAVATFLPEHGKLKQTGAAGHYTLWLRARVLHEASNLFRVVA